VKRLVNDGFYDTTQLCVNLFPQRTICIGKIIFHFSEMYLIITLSYKPKFNVRSPEVVALSIEQLRRELLASKSVRLQNAKGG